MAMTLSELRSICSTCDTINLPDAARCQRCGQVMFGASANAANEKTPAVLQEGKMPQQNPLVAKPKLPADVLKTPFPSARPTKPPPPRGQPPVLTKQPGSPSSAPAFLGKYSPSLREVSSAAAGGKLGLRIVRGCDAGNIFPLVSELKIGTTKGATLFASDPYLAPLHATIFVKDGRISIRDEGGASGVFVRITSPEPIFSNGEFAAGNHRIRFMGPLTRPTSNGPIIFGAPRPSAPIPGGPLYCLENILEGDRPGNACVRPGPILTVGRSGCDLSFPTDKFLQSRHCEIVVGPQGSLLQDYGTVDGTFVRLVPGSERSLVVGDVVRMGIHLLRVELVS